MLQGWYTAGEERCYRRRHPGQLLQYQLIQRRYPRFCLHVNRPTLPNEWISREMFKLYPLQHLQRAAHSYLRARSSWSHRPCGSTIDRRRITATEVMSLAGGYPYEEISASAGVVGIGSPNITGASFIHRIIRLYQVRQGDRHGKQGGLAQSARLLLCDGKRPSHRHSDRMGF